MMFGQVLSAANMSLLLLAITIQLLCQCVRVLSESEELYHGLDIYLYAPETLSVGVSMEYVQSVREILVYTNHPEKKLYNSLDNVVFHFITHGSTLKDHGSFGFNDNLTYKIFMDESAKPPSQKLLNVGSNYLFYGLKGIASKKFYYDERRIKNNLDLKKPNFRWRWRRRAKKIILIYSSNDGENFFVFNSCHAPDYLTGCSVPAIPIIIPRYTQITPATSNVRFNDFCRSVTYNPKINSTNRPYLCGSHLYSSLPSKVEHVIIPSNCLYKVDEIAKDIVDNKIGVSVFFGWGTGNDPGTYDDLTVMRKYCQIGERGVTGNIFNSTELTVQSYTESLIGPAVMQYYAKKSSNSLTEPIPPNLNSNNYYIFRHSLLNQITRYEKPGSNMSTITVDKITVKPDNVVGNERLRSDKELLDNPEQLEYFKNLLQLVKDNIIDTSSRFPHLADCPDTFTPYTPQFVYSRPLYITEKCSSNVNNFFECINAIHGIRTGTTIDPAKAESFASNKETYEVKYYTNDENYVSYMKTSRVAPLNIVPIHRMSKLDKADTLYMKRYGTIDSKYSPFHDVYEHSSPRGEKIFAASVAFFQARGYGNDNNLHHDDALDRILEYVAEAYYRIGAYSQLSAASHSEILKNDTPISPQSGNIQTTGMVYMDPLIIVPYSATRRIRSLFKPKQTGDCPYFGILLGAYYIGNFGELSHTSIEGSVYFSPRLLLNGEACVPGTKEPIRSCHFINNDIYYAHSSAVPSKNLLSVLNLEENHRTGTVLDRLSSLYGGLHAQINGLNVPYLLQPLNEFGPYSHSCSHESAGRTPCREKLKHLDFSSEVTQIFNNITYPLILQYDQTYPINKYNSNKDSPIQEEKESIRSWRFGRNYTLDGIYNRLTQPVLDKYMNIVPTNDNIELAKDILDNYNLHQRKAVQDPDTKSYADYISVLNSLRECEKPTQDALNNGFPIFL